MKASSAETNGIVQYIIHHYFRNKAIDSAVRSFQVFRPGERAGWAIARDHSTILIGMGTEMLRNGGLENGNRGLKKGVVKAARPRTTNTRECPPPPGSLGLGIGSHILKCLADVAFCWVLFKCVSTKVHVWLLVYLRCVYRNSKYLIPCAVEYWPFYLAGHAR